MIQPNLPKNLTQIQVKTNDQHEAGRYARPEGGPVFSRPVAKEGI